MKVRFSTFVWKYVQYSISFIFLELKTFSNPIWKIEKKSNFPATKAITFYMRFSLRYSDSHVLLLTPSAPAAFKPIHYHVFVKDNNMCVQWGSRLARISNMSAGSFRDNFHSSSMCPRVFKWLNRPTVHRSELFSCMIW